MKVRERYAPNYRQKQMKIIVDWLEAGESGTVVGLAGAGKSNFLRFLCHYPNALQQYLRHPDSNLKIIPIPVDLNNIPVYDLSTFYRIILRAFYEAREQFETQLQPTIIDFYRQNQRELDPFVSQSALRELLFLMEAEEIRIVLVIDQFDSFCREATPQMFDTLRGFRDSFKKNLCYLVGVRQEISYLDGPINLGEMHELVDSYTCWIGPMEEDEARQMIQEETISSPKTLSAEEEALILSLTGGHPALLKATCRWWRTEQAQHTPADQWTTLLLSKPSIHNRLSELWQGLTQEEQLILSELEKLQTQIEQKKIRKKAQKKAYQDLQEQYQYPLTHLEQKGFGYPMNNGTQWRLNGDLLANFVAEVKNRGRGRVWYDEKSNQFWQGKEPLQFSPQLHTTLHYFVENPRKGLSKDDLIMAIWPEDWAEINESALYQIIRQLRKEIEPIPSTPRYIVRWSGSPQNGYQFFPEGRAG